MKHIGLFEGIGGFSLAGCWMGWETVAWCEWDTFCQRVLKHHFPNAESHGYITTTDFTRYAGQIADKYTKNEMMRCVKAKLLDQVWGLDITAEINKQLMQKT